MRLIDANKLSKDIQDYFTDKINKGEYEVDTVDCNADIQAILKKQPTAYDPDKTVEQLKAEYKPIDTTRRNGKTLRMGFNGGIARAIEIVKGETK